MRASKKGAIERFVRRKGMVRVSDVMKQFSLSKSATFTYMKTIGALTSFNAKGQFYIIPEAHSFSEDGLKFIGDVGFFEGGNLLAVICHLVESSSSGLGVRELNAMLKTDVHSQIPGLFKAGRLSREPAAGRPGRAYVYFSGDDEIAKKQREAYYCPTPSEEAETDEPSEPEIGPEELPDVIDVLLALICNPGASAKSVALSLQRRGKRINTAFSRRVFQAYDLSKKRD